MRQMSKKMRVFFLIVLGVLVAFLSFTIVMYTSMKEMERNREQNASVVQEEQTTQEP